MAAISKFSTQENYTKIKEGLATIDEAIREAQLAEAAGITGASEALKLAQDTKQKLLNIHQTYFPNGPESA